uniref:Uncharacterized protein n=1 Tax=Pseudo-nitzschia australis TaxID=44445 RepID=A0A6V0CZ69_9STRA|mmetsp:Transcript_19231/g.41802  ORF Transcript_19231/g.41802 Transcript_19231/m.41802 type:complete len:624 (+) Transcript_19231:162-2033(+)|eukprot:CAMPEP_0168211186 /NCGR_PEP_ID=MMETSP0140_2-20121125/3573_1 /TAXON_ID=44445 /ORGANISM="Pseudo-nitzschia australis, Strain 10249 10 AB" /LENGTH=623 /DNA_ID=CAMNT_0008137845 /DNA_START=121 /DNA_END=1992 /DNA_ORIENTATION=-
MNRDNNSNGVYDVLIDYGEYFGEMDGISAKKRHSLQDSKIMYTSSQNSVLRGSSIKEPHSSSKDTEDDRSSLHSGFLSSDEDDSYLKRGADRHASSNASMRHRRRKFEGDRALSTRLIILSFCSVAFTLSGFQLSLFLSHQTIAIGNPAPTEPVEQPRQQQHQLERKKYKQRKVDFLSVGKFWKVDRTFKTTYEFTSQDAFSAAWWQSKERFLECKKVENITHSPEGASFVAFNKIGAKHMRVTRDWMDLGIEHMSKWWKVVLDYNYEGRELQDADVYIDRILDIFRNYVTSEDRRNLWDSITTDDNQKDWLEVSQSTIAVIAFMADSGKRGDELIQWSLAATIMSLRQLGVGRVVVSGAQKKDRRIVKKAFEVVDKATEDWDPNQTLISGMEFCFPANPKVSGTIDDVNIPMGVLKQMRHVFLNKTSSSVTKCWLGGEDNRGAKWNYVYLGEPDLLLTTRPSSTAALAKELKDGNLLAPHRLQPIPHSADFQQLGARREENGAYMLPQALPGFDRVIEADHIDSEWACCDAGNNKPKYEYEYEKCPNEFWWLCGFDTIKSQHGGDDSGSKGDDATTMKPVSVAEAHKIIHSYPLIRLTKGTGVVFAGSEAGRMCRPQLGPCA